MKRFVPAVLALPLMLTACGSDLLDLGLAGGEESQLEGDWEGSFTNDGSSWDLELTMDGSGHVDNVDLSNRVLEISGGCGTYWYDGVTFQMKLNTSGAGAPCDSSSKGFEGQLEAGNLVGDYYDGSISSENRTGTFRLDRD
jgi:hypothetical protein